MQHAQPITTVPSVANWQRGRTPRGRLVVLALMLFLEHAILGAWVPLLQLHLRSCGFTGSQIASCYATLASAAIIAPWVAGQLADRVLPAQVVMFISHLFGAVLLWWTAGCTRFQTVWVLLQLNALVYMPTLALSNLIAFRHLADREQEFGHVRLWGTASWIIVAGLLGVWLSRPGWLPPAAEAGPVDGLRLGAVLAVTLAVFSLALPKTPPEKTRGSRLAALGALKLLRDRSCAVLLLVSFLLALAMPFVYPFGSLFLRSLGVGAAGVAPLMALGQAGEIIAFFILGTALRRWGVKLTFLIGIAGWALRFAIWSLGGPWPLIVASLGLHGACYAFVFGLGQMFVDHQAEPDTRASAQTLHLVITFGVGSWLGNLLAGLTFDHYQATGGPADFRHFYLWPAIGSAVCLLIFGLFFRTPRRHATPPPAAPDPPR